MFLLPISREKLHVVGTQAAMYGTAYLRDGRRDYREFRNRFMTRFSGTLVRFYMFKRCMYSLVSFAFMTI